MQITLKLKKFHGPDGLEHISTDYRVYADKDKKTLITKELNGQLLIFAVDVFLPVGSTFYVEATRKFNIPNIEYKPELFEFTNNNDAISNMIVTQPVSIDRPIVEVSKEQILSPDGENFTVKSSGYRGYGDGHTHNNWLFYDRNNKLIFRKIESLDKKEIQIPKSLVRDLTGVTFLVQHCSNNIVSQAGKTIILFDKVNFEITSKLNNVPHDTYTLKIAKIEKSKNMRVDRVDIFDPSMTLVKTAKITGDQDMVSIMVPRDVITNNVSLKIEIIGYTERGVVNKIVRELKPMVFKHSDVRDRAYVYDKTVDVFVDDEYIFEFSDVSTDFVNGLNIIPVGDKLNYIKFDYATKKFKLRDQLKNVSLLNNNVDGTYIKYLDSGTMIVDTFNDDGDPVFLIYKHTIYQNNFILLHMVPRTDETKPLGFTNSVIQIARNKLLYAVVGSNQLRELNVETGEIKDVITVGEGTNNTILSMLDGRVLILSNNTHKTSIYRPKSKDLIAGPSIPSGDIVKRALKAIELINGDWLIFSNEDSENKAIYLDNSEHKLLTTDITLDASAGNNILPLSGEVALCRKKLANNVDSLPVRTRIERFK